MQLRSSVFIRSGHKSSQHSGSNPSTRASTSRTINAEPSLAQQQEKDLETSSESSMSTEQEFSSGNMDHTGLDYNTKLNFQGSNAYGAKIYKDNQGRYVVKVEDHPSPDEPSIMANYQGDRYMAPLGVMYLVVEDPDFIGTMGEPMPQEEPIPEKEEKPPTVDLNELRLINSLQTQRIPIDDKSKALYTHGEKGERNFYGGMHPQPHTLTPEKTLYTFYPRNAKAMGVLIFLDKYGQEWSLLEEAELTTYLHMGIPVSFYLAEEEEPAGTSTAKNKHNVGFAAGFKEPPKSTKIETEKSKKESTARHGHSGHSGFTGTKGPGGIFGSKHTGSMGGYPHGKPPMEHPRKTRPSNFQKWVKKYNGSGDPYDHLATANH